jgi:hypothetical protein
MVIYDEGKRKGLQRNERATQLFLYGRRSDDFIVGDALVCRNAQIK